MSTFFTCVLKKIDRKFQEFRRMTDFEPRPPIAPRARVVG